MTRNRYQKNKQCCGVVLKKNNSSRKHSVRTERCQVFVSNAQLEVCVNPKQDMCYMHCDCEGCSSKYTATANRGKRYTELEKENTIRLIIESNGYEKVIMNENDIEKLRAICLTLNSKYPHLMTTVIKESKEIWVLYKKQKEIEKYENHIKKLRSEIDEIRSR